MQDKSKGEGTQDMSKGRRGRRTRAQAITRAVFRNGGAIVAQKTVSPDPQLP